MSFNNEDILTLAKAGFTAQQIAALSQVQTVAPAQTQAPAVQTPAVQAPAVQTPAVQAPAVQTQAQMPITAVQTGIVPTSVQSPAPAQSATDDILKAINGLSTTIQSGMLQNAQQPTPPTAESILAEIINPPIKKGE